MKTLLPAVLLGCLCVAAFNAEGQTVSFSTAAQATTETGAPTVTVTVNISSAPAASSTVDVRVTGGTATQPNNANADFSALSGSLAATPTITTLTFAAGVTTPQTFTFTIVDDAIVEPTETIIFGFANFTGNITGAAGITAQTVSIADNDTGIIQFPGTQFIVNEHSGTVTVTVNMANNQGGPATVNVTAAGVTTTSAQWPSTALGYNGTVAATMPNNNGADISALSGSAANTPTVTTLNWALTNNTPQTFTFNVINDNFVEGPETFTFTLSGASGATLGANIVATYLIQDDDELVAFTAPHFMVREDGTVLASVTARSIVPLSYVADTSSYTVNWTTVAPPGGPSGVNVNNSPNLLRPGSDYATPGADYTASSGSLTWSQPGGQLNGGVSKTLTVSILQDTLVEPNEDILIGLRGVSGNVDLTLTGPSFATASANTGIVLGSLGVFGVRTNCTYTIVFDDPPAGAVDENFNSVVRSGGVIGTIPNPGANNSVLAVALQPDGRVILGGEFTGITGTNLPINRIARVSALGRPDTSFIAGPGTGADAYVQAIALYTNTVNNGKIMIGGGFTTIGGVSSPAVARLNSDGTLDNAFNVGVGANGPVRALAIQPSDGKVIVAGEFTFINGVARNRIARLNTDGSVDSTFNPGNGANDIVYSVTIHPPTDPVVANRGKILVVGDFTVMDTTTATRVTRLNANGTVDTSFTPGTGADATVRASLIDTNGQPVLGGNFTTFDGQLRPGVVRLTTNGTVDATFALYTVGTTNVYALALDTSAVNNHAVNNGKILVGGYFNYFNGTYRKCIVRLNTNGMVDTSFMDRAYNQNAGLSKSQPPVAANDAAVAYALAVQSDSSVIVGGNFTTVGGAERVSLAGGMGPAEWITRTNMTQQNNFARLVGAWGVSGANNDPNPPQGPGSVVFAVPTLGVLEDSTPNATFYIHRSFDGTTNISKGYEGTMNGGIRVHYASSNVTATAGSDYTGVNSLTGPGTVVKTEFDIDWKNPNLSGPSMQIFTPTASTEAVRSISITPDNLVEGNEDFIIALFSLASTNTSATGTPTAGTFGLPVAQTAFGKRTDPTLATPIPYVQGIYQDLTSLVYNYDEYDITTDPAYGFQAQMTVTIIDDDFSPGTLSLTASAFSTNENAGSITFTVTRTGGSVGPVTIDYTTVEPTITGRAGNVLTVSTPHHFQTGNRIVFSTVGTATLPTGITAGLTYEVVMTGANTFTLLFGGLPVTLTSSFTGVCKVKLVDYTAASGTLNFASGQTNKTFTIPLIDNTYVDVSSGNAAYTRVVDIQLSNPTGGSTLGAPSSATLTITDNETLNAIAGAVDTGFNAGTGPNLQVNAVDVYQTAYTGPGIQVGQIVAVGDFTSWNGLSRNRLVRLKLDGSLDTAFSIGTGANNSIRAVAIHPTGDNNASKVVIGGDFTTFNGLSRSRFANVLPSGALDTTFGNDTSTHSVLALGTYTNVALPSQLGNV